MSNYIKQSNGKCSLMLMKIEPNRSVYRFDVQLKTPYRDLVRQSDRGLAVMEKQCCYDLMKQAWTENEGFGLGKEVAYVYDGRTILYLKNQIEAQMFTLDPNNMTIRARNYLRGNTVEVEIKPNENYPQIDYSDFASALYAPDGTFRTDRSIQSFFDLLTSQSLINNHTYRVLGSGALFELEVKNSKPGMQTFDGLQKGVKVVDAKTMYLVVDMNRLAFYSSADRNGDPGTLAQVLRSFGNPRDFRTRTNFASQFKGVRMQPIYAPERTFVFFGLSEAPIGDRRYNLENGLSIPQYFLATHGLTIDSELPGCHRKGSKEVIYPLDMVQVFAGQQFLQERAPADLENSINPNERYAFIAKHVRKLTDAGPGAEFLRKFGVTIVANSNDVVIQQCKLPQIRVLDQKNQKKMITPIENGSFFKDIMAAKLLISREMLKHWIVAFDGHVPKQMVHTYVEGLVDRCMQSGLKLPQPEKYVETSIEQMELVFKEAKKEGAKTQFILYLDDKFISRSHAKLKLFEAKYKILTQQISMQNMDLNKGQTIKNVVMKLNSKFFGLNYAPVFDSSVASLDLEKNPDLLVIGYDVAHPTRASPYEIKQMRESGLKEVNSIHPSVVGISSNKNKTPYSFSADFFYQESLQEKVSAHRLTTAVEDIVKFAFLKKEVVPTRLFIVRDGVSEGQYDMVMNEELPAIRRGYEKAMQTLEEKYHGQKPTITLMIATKRHHKRFFRMEGNEYKNTRPGDLITQFGRTDVIYEFFLQTHHPIKGMPKATQYTVLLNEMELGRQLIEKFVILLSNMHQVSACSTSLPLPVYQADETAARGLEIYNELKRMRSESNAPDFVRNLRVQDGMFDFDELTQLLSYGKSPLAGTRYNS